MPAIWRTPLGKLRRGKSCYALLLLCITTAIALRAQTLTKLHDFDGTHGAEPTGLLVQATDGNLYGTTFAGGLNNSTYCLTCGTVFKITPSGKLTTLYEFCSQGIGFGCTDGAGPLGGLIQATDGNFYGTTSNGGANGLGTVFKITPGGKLTTLYTFCSQSDCTDGGAPYAGLIQATDGNLYGTTPTANGEGGAPSARSLESLPAAS